jgi:hypothetical protein
MFGRDGSLKTTKLIGMLSLAFLDSMYIFQRSVKGMYKVRPSLQAEGCYVSFNYASA